jgi:alkanesulfonate monooxygenase SsuD/methylene tetrahydromethanopterin reductase-like flavin-dependent oxidoreductase (luciferase family)
MKDVARFGWALPPEPVDEMIQVSQLCEKNNFDSVWWMDHLMGVPNVNDYMAHQVPEVFTTMMAIGQQTEKITVGAAVSDVLRRHPAVMAQTIATIDSALKGRTALGIGPGNGINQIPFGIPLTNAVQKLREGIQVMKLLWKSDSNNLVDYEGKFFKLKKACLQVEPFSKPNPPVYVGAHGSAMLALAGEIGDGWIPHAHTPESYSEYLAIIRDAAKSAGRELDGFDPGYQMPFAISKDREEARRIVEGPAKGYFTFAPYVLKKLAPDIPVPDWLNPFAFWSRKKESDEAKQRLLEQIPTELALRSAIWGTPDDCIEKIDDFIRAGCRHFVLTARFMRKEKMNEAAKLFGQKVIPHFRDKN